METKLSIEEIEWLMINHDGFNYRKDLFVPNVKTGFTHEMDLVRLTTSGYVEEYEIKRSWSDFLADFKKEHHHKDEKVRKFFYVLPISIYEKCKNYLEENKIICDGIYTYTEDKKTEFHSIECERSDWCRKLFLEEKFDLARYSNARMWKMKEKIAKLKYHNIK